MPGYLRRSTPQSVVRGKEAADEVARARRAGKKRACPEAPMLLYCRASVVTLQSGLFSALARCSHPEAPMLLLPR